jgi:predicted RNase H-like HicB family nuclease
MYLLDLVWRKSLVGEKMETLKFVYYQENDMWVGWLEEFPDYRTQGASLDELKENLKDIYQDLNEGKIPHARRYGELIVG